MATPIPFTVECPANTQLNTTLGPLVNATFEVLGWRYLGLTGPVYVAGPILNLGPSAFLALDVTLFVRAKTDLLVVPPLPFSTTFAIHGVAGVATANSPNIVVSGTIVAADTNRAAIDLVLDRSHFMDTTTTARTKAACLRLLDFMTDADWLGVVVFTTSVARRFSVRELTLDNRNFAKSCINALKATTADSSIFQVVSSVSASLDELPNACACVPASRAMLLASMGEESVPGFPVPAPGAARRFAIALGATPGVIPSVTPDYFMLGNTSDPNEMFRLDKFLLQSLAQMSSLAVILDPSGTLSGSHEVSIPFEVADTDSNVRILLLVDEPEYVQLELKVGDQRVSPHEFPGASLVCGSGSLEFALDRTVLEQAHADEEGCNPHLKRRHDSKGQAVPAPIPSKTWNAVLSLSKEALTRGTRLRPVPWTLIVFAQSDLVFTASAHLDSEYIGGTAFLSAWLSEHKTPVTGERARVWAEVSYPDGGSGRIPLTETVDGRFEANVRCTIPGAYRYRILAAGSTFRGKRFKRELTRSTFTRSRPSQDCVPCVAHQPCAPRGKHKHHAPQDSAEDDEHDELEG